MKYLVDVDGERFEVILDPAGMTVDGQPVEADLARVPGTPLRHLLLDGASHPVVADRRPDGRWSLHLRGMAVSAEAVDERTHAIRAMTGAGSGPRGPRPVRAPMPGLVVKIEVAAGDSVEAGQGVAIVEAMKMENELKAETAAVVSAVHVAAGDTVEKDQVLVEFAVDAGDGRE